jgi:hypothetical protein
MTEPNRVSPSYERRDRFLIALQSSGLVGPQKLQQILIDFESLQSTGRSLDAFCSYLIRHEILTEWQSHLLRTGCYKGFILDNYRLLYLLQTKREWRTCLAEDTSTGKRVLLSVSMTFTKGESCDYRLLKVFDE